MTTLAANNLEQIDKKVLEAFVAGMGGYISSFEKIWNIREPERKDERFTIVKTDSAVREVGDGAAFPTQEVSEIGANEISQKLFKSAIPIGDFAELFNSNTKIEESAMTHGYHFRANIDSMCTAFFNNATSVTAPYGINIAGATTAMVSATQPIGDSGTTQSNRISGNLSKITANNARVALRKMQDHDGMTSVFQPRRLVVPSEELMNAWEIFRSPNEPESANRNNNYLNTIGVEIIENPLLSSTTACFMLADQSSMGARGLKLLIKENPTIRRVKNDETGNWNYQFRMALNAGLADYVGIVSIGL